MSFRHWLEDLNDPRGIQDTEGMSQHWYKNLPKEEPKQNEAAISIFVNRMSEDKICGIMLADHLHGIEVYQILYDNKPISGNLLNIVDGRLGLANGIVSNKESPEFSFKFGGTNAGNLYIVTPPMIYEQSDRQLLASIIYHELGHAIDYLQSKPYDIPSGRFRFNAEAYASNLNEARRYSDQLRWLLKKVGDSDKVFKLLAGERDETPEVTTQYRNLKVEPPMESPFRLPAALLPVASSFLYRFHKDLAESWMPYTNNSAASPILAPLVSSEQQRDVKQCVQLVKNIIGLMLFRNFVIKS